jgi:hypothetical protein
VQEQCLKHELSPISFKELIDDSIIQEYGKKKRGRLLGIINQAFEMGIQKFQVHLLLKLRFIN